jgi:hypothetical protein
MMLMRTQTAEFLQDDAMEKKLADEAGNALVHQAHQGAHEQASGLSEVRC